MLERQDNKPQRTQKIALYLQGAQVEKNFAFRHKLSGFHVLLAVSAQKVAVPKGQKRQIGRCTAWASGCQYGNAATSRKIALLTCEFLLCGHLRVSDFPTLLPSRERSGSDSNQHNLDMIVAANRPNPFSRSSR